MTFRANSLFCALAVAEKHHAGDCFDEDDASIDWDQYEKEQDTRGTMKTQLQRPAAPAAPKRMKLGAVSNGILREPDRILIYGVGGVGKSTFLAESPSPIFIDTQSGTTRLNVARFPKPGVWQDVLDALDELAAEQHSYKTLAVDLLDDIEELIWKHICERDDQPNVIAYGYGKGFDVALSEWRIFMSRIERLRREKGMAVIMAAHTAVKSFKNPEGEDYDRYGMQINDKASGVLRGWCDTVLLARHETVLKTDKRKRTRGISTGARLIHTVETAAYFAKNRDNLPDTLPLDYAAFAAAVEAGQPADPAAIRAEIAELAAKVDEATRAKVEHNVKNAGEDASRLVRILNRLREIQPQQQQGEAQ